MWLAVITWIDWWPKWIVLIEIFVNIKRSLYFIENRLRIPSRKEFVCVAIWGRKQSHCDQICKCFCWWIINENHIHIILQPGLQLTKFTPNHPKVGSKVLEQSAFPLLYHVLGSHYQMHVSMPVSMRTQSNSKLLFFYSMKMRFLKELNDYMIDNYARHENAHHAYTKPIADHS